ncbi:MAG: SAM-dependent methyltransferase, partial [Betaproteobacteria bacterium]
VGGRLVYATCSVLPEENRDVVTEFLAVHPEYKLVPVGEVMARLDMPLTAGDYLELSPHQHGCDGFFAAILERIAVPAAEPAAETVLIREFVPI